MQQLQLQQLLLTGKLPFPRVAERRNTMTARSILGAELAQLEAETFEIQDIPELDQNMAGSTSTSSCTSTTSCACSCTSTCSTTSTVTCSCTLGGSTS